MSVVFHIFFFFFFSSRRRHTRYWRDWSSDVCSSDLQMIAWGKRDAAKTLGIPAENVRLDSPYVGGGFGGKLFLRADAVLAALGAKARSEERRVGKECRSRWSPYH